MWGKKQEEGYSLKDKTENETSVITFTKIRYISCESDGTLSVYPNSINSNEYIQNHGENCMDYYEKIIDGVNVDSNNSLVFTSREFFLVDESYPTYFSIIVNLTTISRYSIDAENEVLSVTFNNQVEDDDLETYVVSKEKHGKFYEKIEKQLLSFFESD